MAARSVPVLAAKDWVSITVETSKNRTSPRAPRSFSTRSNQAGVNQACALARSFQW